MPQDILAHGNAANGNVDAARAVRDVKKSGPPAEKDKRFRLPVGVALGLVFSILLVVICGIIITYMAASDRRIAGRLLDEQGVAVLRANEAVLTGFFDRQELLFRSIAAHVAETDARLTAADLRVYEKLLPEGARLETGSAVLVEAPPDELPEISWSAFEIRPGFDTAVKTAELDLGNGQLLIGIYPQQVFADIAREMAFEGRQQVFMLSGRDHAIAIEGLSASDFLAQPGQPLPALETLDGSPLHLIWAPNDQSHDMGGSVTGRVFPGDQGMFTALYTEVGSGPAKGWILGALYKAEEFGAALDQTRIVLYAALVALVVGAVLSFAVGRMLGRPLIRLAHAAAALHQLEFASTDKLPRSRLKELDDVNQAFNGSLGALNAFAKYVPRQLVSRLIEEGMTEARNIELREMTIVFTDLAGFTGMASHLSAEETAAYLNGYFETVSQAITERQGTIDKFLGDGVMAFWGAPADQPDHAAMAIAAVKALADRIAAEPDASMRVRVGVHTGKVVVGDIGSAARMNYTVIGDAVNVAARLQEYGKQVDPEARVIVLASGDTMAQLPEGVSATSLGPIQLRGRTEPLSVFRIA
ncbi:adenylate cyclase 1 protein [Stappia aggregata IAM 12614]|uniref:Adenylate cyclase 1 protein n=1 Tax=Roseibium aggregatum (strain ATCC 25650 / DSM 13394 / JCM 20685 / NBRC 16684 / NCIMB 2208 / IAM 12614 / B1) TaxID=384765 RepID=A0NUX8_ROSAI|nr:adenylate/guanylate cyclase domain-containing protein [Roseibium aggregatum]EAV43245.1 adenylate cyclase 1 protein [Stappia aggregata IAM 12614] [Roseibium aggregatum IAM 12614]